QLPLTSVLVASLIMGSDGLTVMPLVIVAVAVSFITSAPLAPRAAPGPPPLAAGAPRTRRRPVLGLTADSDGGPRSTRRHPRSRRPSCSATLWERGTDRAFRPQPSIGLRHTGAVSAPRPTT